MGILNNNVLLLFLFFHAISCCEISMPYGNTSPDYDIKIGKPLNFNCHLFRTDVEIKNRTYHVTSENLLLKFEKYPLENITVVDKLSAEYYVDAASENDTGSYNCYLVIPGVKPNLLVCSTIISVGYEPKNVTNFSCISYEYRNLTCSWDEPFNPVETSYTLYDYLKKHESFSRKCPVKLSKTSCQWRLDTDPQYYRTSEDLDFMIVGKNSLGEVKQYIHLDHYKIVKPGAPKNFMSFNITETSLVLQWTAPNGMEYGDFRPGLLYSIQYKPVFFYYKAPEEIFVSSIVGGSVKVENLVPNTEYEFKIRCRSNVSDDDNMWSASTILIAGTYPDVPYLAPEIPSSAFEVEKTLGNRTITIYWKSIPPEYENGRNFHYEIQYHIHHVPSRTVRSVSGINVGNKTYHSFPHLDAHTAYIFRIYAVNNIGPSTNSSYIIVDKTERLIEEPKEMVVVSYGHGRYNLSWKVSNRRPTNYTIFYCKTLNSRPAKCGGQLDWFRTSDTKHLLQLSDKSTNYQFAVSASSEGQTSGMSWASCVVSYEGVNYKVKKVEVRPNNSSSLALQWFLECEAQKIVMKEYSIQYCKTQRPCSSSHDIKHCSDWHNVGVKDVSKEEYVLGSLQPFSNYLVYIRVLTVSGWSANSNLVCGKTLSTAPSDPPGNVHGAAKDDMLYLSFTSPLTPNGLVSHYIIFYTDTSDGVSHQKQVLTQHDVPGQTIVANVSMGILYYHNYSIEVVACVMKDCSRKSDPEYVITEMSYPSIIRSPRIEIVDGTVNVTWDSPFLANGPVDYYQVSKETNDTEKNELFNVTAHRYLTLAHDCSNKEDKTVYLFKVRAVNIRDGFPLYGPFSEPTKTTLCPDDIPVAVLVGMIVGITVGTVVITLVMYSLISWMKNEVNMIKDIQIQLPKDLDSPLENPLSSYDKFKNGLQPMHDSGVPCDTSYERLCGFPAEEIKTLGKVSEESQKLKRKMSGRNHSGESNTSVKCHDSISSSNTTKTHLSIDSGTEVDSPPSPDGIFSDISSSHTTPRSYKPDLTIVRENTLNSKDSGLEREGTCHNLDFNSKFTYFVKKRNPYSNILMPSYSKLAVGHTIPCFVPYGEQKSLLENHSLSNSEPSVAEFDSGNCSESFVLSGIQPYSKFGLARSAGTGLNQPFAVSSKQGYSKFGTVYRTLKEQDGISIPVVSDLQTCPKFLPHHPQTFTALPVCSKPLSSVALPKDLDKKAYAKFGLLNRVQKPSNGYVGVQTVLTYPSADRCTSDANQAYSKVGLTPNESKSEDRLEEQKNKLGIVMNGSDLQISPVSNQMSYVTFKNAKGIKNDASNKDNLNLSNGESSEAVPLTNEIEKDLVIVPDVTFSEEFIPDFGAHSNPTSFTVSANNDSMGFIIEDESYRPEAPDQLLNINTMFSPDDVTVLEVTELPLPSNCEGNQRSTDHLFDCKLLNANNSENNRALEHRNLCKKCSKTTSECTCAIPNGDCLEDKIGDVYMCNGHSESLNDVSSGYVPIPSS